MHALAAAGTVSADLIGVILQSAGTGTAIIVVLIILGVLSPKSYTARLEKEAAQWHAAFEASRAEAGEKDKIIAVQTARADAAVEAAQRTADILDRLQARNSDVVPIETQRPHRRS